MVASKKIYDHTPESGTNSNGHSLLSFMNLASNKVKTALEKPNTFKRNINHRRFLQKQFRAMVKSPEKSPGGRRAIARENIDSINFNTRDYNRQSCPPPLSHNFVQFDALDAPIPPNLAYETPNFYVPFARSEGYVQEQTLQRQMQCNAFERGHIRKENHSCLYQSDCASSSLPELIVEEDFLTGEELTQAIELKDLFIPETDLTQYLLNGKDTLAGFCNSDANIDNNLYRDFALQEDILVF
jgi:hypothetical protein